MEQVKVQRQGRTKGKMYQDISKEELLGYQTELYLRSYSSRKFIQRQ